MKIYQFKCRLLTDIVISAGTASEGFKKSLDYIPGTKFLGIAARSLYDKENSEKTIDLFHNGTVRFGDAHPMIESQYSFTAPFSWFSEKGYEATNGVYLHHKLTEKDRSKLQSEGIQLKQIRKGYFLPTGEWLHNIQQNFSLKSAYDSIKRRAKDQQMFGYFALPKGSTWLFSVEDEKGTYIDEIKELLSGKHRIGRSRSAEYGLVKIQFDKEIPINESLIEKEEIILYAQSNLLFYDSSGQPTLQPDPVQLGLPEGASIHWAKSQIRSRLYQTWNRRRHNRDSDRMIIEKGSVLVCKLKEPLKLPVNLRVGSQQPEGFGKIMVNPTFLQSDQYLLNKKLVEIDQDAWIQPEGLTAVKEGLDDQLVLNYLQTQREREDASFHIDREVNNFIKTYYSVFNGISSSQWGMVRNYAKHAANLQCFEDLLFKEEFGCLNRGQSEKDWRKRGRREKLYHFIFQSGKIPKDDIIPFVIKLSSEMPKVK